VCYLPRIQSGYLNSVSCWGLFGCAGQFNPFAGIVDLQAIIRNCDKTTTQAEKSADLNYCEQYFLPVDDNIVQRSDLFVLVMENTVADQLGGPIALRQDGHVDFNQLYRSF
jgi:hypothetical protein